MSKLNIKLRFTTFDYAGEADTTLTAKFDHALKQWTVSQDGKPFYAIPILDQYPEVSDRTAEVILRRALKIDE